MEEDDIDVKFIPPTQEVSGNLRVTETRALNAVHDLLKQRVTRCEQLEVSRNELLQQLQVAEAAIEKQKALIQAQKIELEKERNIRKDLESAAEKREEEMKNLVKTQIEKDVTTKLLQERLAFSESAAQHDKKALKQAEEKLKDFQQKNQLFSSQLTGLSAQADSLKREVAKLKKERDEAVETKNKVVEEQSKILTLSKTLNDELKKMNVNQNDSKSAEKNKQSSTVDSTSNKNEAKRGPLKFPTGADSTIKSEPSESLKVTIRQSPTRDIKTDTVLTHRSSAPKRIRNIMGTPFSINRHHHQYHDERFAEDTRPYHHQRGSWDNGRRRYPIKRKYDYE